MKNNIETKIKLNKNYSDFFIFIINLIIVFELTALLFPAVLTAQQRSASIHIEETYLIEQIECGIKKEITSEILIDRTRFDNNETLIDERLPDGSKEILPVAFDDAFSFCGAKSIALKSQGRQTAYYINPASQYKVEANENIVFYLKSPVGEIPRSFIIAFYDETGSSEHRAYFGRPDFDFGGTDGTFSNFNAGELSIEGGVWYRAVIPASAVDMGGLKICGVLAAKSDGAVYIDKITKSEIINDKQKFRLEKVENILTIYKNSFTAITLTPENAMPYSSGEINVKHSNAKTYSKKLQAAADGSFFFDLTDGASGEVIPSGPAVFELKYKNTDGANSSASAKYEILQLIANIRLPWKESLVNATVPIFGDALGVDFSHYTLGIINLNSGALNSAEVKIAESKEPKFLTGRALNFSGKATVTGNLASFNAGTNFGYKYERGKIKAQQAYNGLYRLVLTVYDTRGNARTDTRDIIIGRLISNTAEQFVESADNRAAIIVGPYSITEGFTMCSLIDAASFAGADRTVFNTPPGFTPISPIYEARPRGLGFDRPALLKIMADGGNLTPASCSLFQYTRGAGWSMLDTACGPDGELSAPIAGFNAKSKTFFAAFKGDTAKFKTEKPDMFISIKPAVIKAPPIIVKSPSHPFLTQCDFENGHSILTPRSLRNNTEISFDDKVKAGGRYSLKITNKITPSDCAVNIYPAPYDAAEFPLLSFDYNCPPTVEINIMIKALGRFYEIPLSSPTAGSAIGHKCLPAQNFIRDSNWHNLTINIFELVKNVTAELKEDSPLIIDEIFFCDFDYEGWAEVADGRNPPGASFNIDNLRITSGGSNNKKIEFNWEASDKNIVKFSFSIDDNPAGAAANVPSADLSTAFDAFASQSGKDAFYLHITGFDAAGKALTALSHFMVKIDNSPPQVTAVTPPEGSEAASSIITAVIDDFNGSGVNAATIKCEVDGFLYSAGDGALTYESGSKLMKIEPYKKIPAPPGFIDGQKVKVKIYGVKDNAGNIMKNEYSFSFGLNFSSMAAGRDAVITTTGGFFPCFTPDSKNIIYCAPKSSKMQIYSIPVGGKKTFAVSKDSEADYLYPKVLANNDIIACKKNRGALNYHLVTMAPDGAREKKLLALAETDIISPAVSASSQIVYFSAGNDIYSLDLKTGTHSRLLFDQNAFMLDPAVSPDGRFIAFRKDLYTNTIWLCGKDSGEQRPLTLDGSEFNPSFSADGSSVLFTRIENDITSIYTINADGSQLKRLITNGFFDARLPVMSPDGRYIAYESARSGLWNISLFSLIYTPETAVEIIGIKKDETPAAASGAELKTPAVKVNYETSGDDTLVSIKIYDGNNALIKVLAEDKKEFGGTHSIIWDGITQDNKPAAQSKPYIVKFEFKSKKSAEPAVKVAKIAFNEKAAAADIDFAGLRKQISSEEIERKNAEIKKSAILKETITKGGDDIPPAPVAGFKAKPGVNKIELHWQKNTEADLHGYKITRIARENGASQTYNVNADKNSYADNTAESGKSYSYSIAAFDAFGNSSAIRELTAAAEFDYLYFALPYNDKTHILKFNLNELVIELYENLNQPPLFKSPILAPDNLEGGSFSFSCSDGSYALYCLNAESGELYYAKSSNLKAFSAWELINAEFYHPPGAAPNGLITSFIQSKNSRVIKAVCLDTQNETLYEGELVKNSSAISWKLLYRGFMSPPEETLSYSLEYDEAKYILYSLNQSSKAVYSSITTNFKAFSAWRKEL